MGTTAALVLELAITAMQHATELNQLLQTAATEGRDITPDELATARGQAVDAQAKLKAVLDQLP